MTTNKQEKYDRMYMDVAKRMSEMSFARRKKVGCVCVKNDRIISHGWNGTPTGFDNNCEIEDACGNLVTKVECLHAESNTLLKLAKHGDSGKDATLYTLLAPCIECAKLIIQTGITRVVYSEVYPVDQFSRQSGLDLLAKANILVERLDITPSGRQYSDDHDCELEATEPVTPDDASHFGH